MCVCNFPVSRVALKSRGTCSQVKHLGRTTNQLRNESTVRINEEKVISEWPLGDSDRDALRHQILNPARLAGQCRCKSGKIYAM